MHERDVRALALRLDLHVGELVRCRLGLLLLLLLHAIVGGVAQALERTERQSRHNIVGEHVARNDARVLEREIGRHRARARVRVAVDRNERVLLVEQNRVQARDSGSERMARDDELVAGIFLQPPSSTRE